MFDDLLEKCTLQSRKTLLLGLDLRHCFLINQKLVFLEDDKHHYKNPQFRRNSRR